MWKIELYITQCTTLVENKTWESYRKHGSEVQSLLKQCTCVLSHFSHIQLFVTPWLLCPRDFSQQEYWSLLSCPTPGYPLNPGIELCLLYLLHCRWILYHLTHRGSLYKGIQGEFCLNLGIDKDGSKLCRYDERGYFKKRDCRL